jgi:hypothetical protein
MRIKWLIILFFPVALFSQKNSCHCKFQGIVSVGMAAGESSTKALFQLSGGINTQDYFMGVGFGIDPYRFQSVPVFADWRINLDKTRFGFLYANAGFNFPYGDNENISEPFKTSDHFRGGFYMDAGVGYRFPMKGWSRLLLSAGYSHKRINNVVGYHYSWCPSCPDEKYTYQYDLGRIVTKLSWEFGRMK